ncbi:hypothetical protein BDW62DRAFT_38652 [Aspergillus aurantiobrunneus]
MIIAQDPGRITTTSTPTGLALLLCVYLDISPLHGRSLYCCNTIPLLILAPVHSVARLRSARRSLPRSEEA